LDHEERLHSEQRQDPGQRKSVTIFVDNDRLSIPVLSHEANDAALLREVKMFYRYLKVKRGLSEVVIPKQLISIDYVVVRRSKDF